ncbi:MAG TPA: polysaccharide biosynthesis tyrosine autokinase [Longimicrobium sp.]|nr:polysaccharide biosynthesis tyrosine autokinase [Longimicrobium sp.]
MKEVHRSHASAEDADGLSLVDVWRTLSRNRWLVVAVAAAVVVLGAVITKMQSKVYGGTTTVLIEEKRPAFSLISDMSPLGGGRSQIETDIAVLQSRQVAEAVVDSLAMQVAITEPEVPRSRVLRVIRAPKLAKSRNYRLEPAQGGTYRVVPDSASEPTLATARIGQPVTFEGLTIVLLPGIRTVGRDDVRLTVQAYRRAVQGVRGELTASRQSRDVQIVTLNYRDTDPELAAAVPNAAAASFIRYKARTGSSETHATVGFLREQVSSYEGQLRAAEADLRSFREAARVVSPAEEATEQVKRLAARKADRDGKVAERQTLAQLLSRVTAEANQPGDHSSSYRQLASFPVFLENRAVQDMLQAITSLENRRADLLIQRTPTNQDVQGVNQRIRELETQLFTTAENYLRSLDSQISSLDSELSRYSTEMEAIPAREVEYARRLREQKLLEELYTLLQTRLKEAEITDAVEPSDVRVVDAALVPEDPISPQPLKNMALAMVFGVLLAAASAFAREGLDTKVRNKDDAVAMAGGVPVLGTIPRINAPAEAAGGRRGKQRDESRLGTVLGSRLVTQHAPHSPVAEAYRSLRTNITFASLDKAPRVVVVTSAMPGDGKSTSASNLAMTLAQQGTRTLLVDADLRKGMLHHILSQPQEPGLTHVLMGQVGLEEAVREVEVPGSAQPLYVLTVGLFPPNPAELVGSPRMRTLVEEMRRLYDTVIFDAPPLNLVTDAALLGTLADTTLLVARAGITEKEALRHAAGQLHLLHARVGGLVLNDFDARLAGYRYGTDGYYGYAAYGNGHGNGNGNGNGKPR